MNKPSSDKLTDETVDALEDKLADKPATKLPEDEIDFAALTEAQVAAAKQAESADASFHQRPADPLQPLTQSSNKPKLKGADWQAAPTHTRWSMQATYGSFGQRPKPSHHSSEAPKYERENKAPFGMTLDPRQIPRLQPGAKMTMPVYTKPIDFARRPATYASSISTQMARMAQEQNVPPLSNWAPLVGKGKKSRNF